jgi:Tat protein secretion system quality control protein TatD with DNase activity|tara:strand:+ start:1133 stop:1462 length:330 start_codon:yes stop_codon:yes gene_type:complete
MKLSITLNNKTYSVESEEQFDGSNLNELAEQFKGLLVGAGFHPSNVDDMFNTEYQWFTQEERDDNMQGHLKDNKYNEGYSKGWDQALHNEKVQRFQDCLYKQDDDDMFS